MTTVTTVDFDPSFEGPVAASRAPGFVDTFNFTLYDASLDLGGVMTMNSFPNSPNLWRQCVMLFHPSGDVLLGRGFARTGRGIVSANLTYTCLEPFRRWLLQFDGFLQRVPADALTNGRVADHPEVPVAFTLEYTSVMPAWGHVTAAEVAGSHYEQNGFIRGTVTCAGENYSFDGVGFRDRLAGPKGTALMAGHNWIHGTMPDGRAFALTQVRLKSDPDNAPGPGCIAVGGVVHPAEVVKAELWDGSPGVPPGLDIVLRSDLGDTSLRIDPLRSVPWMYVTSDSVPLQPAVFGHDRAWPDGLLFWESSAVVTWDGQRGYGHIEQSHVNA